MSPAATAYVAPGLARPKVTPAAVKREVDAVMASITEEVANLSNTRMRALAPVLAQAEHELAADLKSWLANVTDGDARFTAQRMRSALLQLRKSMATIHKVIPGAVEKTLVAQGGDAGRMAIRHLQDEVASFAAVFGHSVRPIQINQAAILAQGEKFLIPRYRSSAARYGADMTRDIRNQLAVGVARGETFHEMTDRLVRLRGPRGLVSLRGVLGEPGSIGEHIAEGLFVKYRGWAERIVRTEGIHAYNVQHLEALYDANVEDPGYQKRWDATRDKMCDICRSLDGVIAELDAGFPPWGMKAPPAHPNCRCALTPWRPEWGSAPAAAQPVALPPAVAVPVAAPKQPKPAKPQRPNLPPNVQITASDQARATFADEFRKAGGDPAMSVEDVIGSFRPPKGYVLRVDHLAQAPGALGGAEFGADITKDGKTIGHLRRQFRRNYDGEMVVVHDSIKLEEPWRGKGIPDAINRNAFNAYERMGVKVVEVREATDVGRYTWLRDGYKIAEHDKAPLLDGLHAWAERKGLPADDIRARGARALEIPGGFAKVRWGDEAVGRAYLLDSAPSYSASVRVDPKDPWYRAVRASHQVDRLRIKEAAPVVAPATAAEPKPSKPDAKQDAKTEVLLQGRVTKRKRLGEDDSGVNVTEVIELEHDGRKVKAVWKPKSGETNLDPDDPDASPLFSNVDPGTYYRRERVAKQVAPLFGVDDMIPDTQIREVDGELGMVQEFRAVKPADAPNPDRATIEKVRLFDYVIGNQDRHDGNVLFDGDKPVLIDHGLSWPKSEGLRSFKQPWHMNRGVLDTRDLLPETVDLIKKIDDRELARIAKAGGIERDAVKAALVRLADLRRDPNRLAVPPPPPHLKIKGWMENLVTLMDMEIRSADAWTNISPDEMGAIGTLLDEVF